MLFDDDGKAWVVWGYRDLKIGQLNADLTDIVEGTERTLFDRDARMGEGSHLYKIDGRYFIISAWWDGRMRMPARAPTVSPAPGRSTRPSASTRISASPRATD